jgi:transposase
MATDSRKDDDKVRHTPVHNGGGDTLRRIEVITGTGRRRRWDAETKGGLVAESFEPGCSVSELARRHFPSPEAGGDGCSGTCTGSFTIRAGLNGSGTGPSRFFPMAVSLG